MKNTPLQSMIDDWFDHMFVVDKRGKTVFFPWGDNKQGYVLKSKSLVAKVKKFYRGSFFICIVVFLIAASLFHNNFWGIVASLVISFGGWYLASYLYVSRIVGSLPIVQTSYNKIILEKLEPEDGEESPQSDIQFPAHWNEPVLQRKREVFGQIQHIWYRLSPGQILMVCFFVGMFTALIWSMYRPDQWIDADYLVGFFVCLLFGYGGFVVTQHMGPAKEDWFAFFQWKLSMIVIMVGGWSFAAWFLYKFVVLIVTER
jgi:hypothetical protein